MKAPKLAEQENQKLRFNAAEWQKDNIEFVHWWKRHRHSGYCLDEEGKSHWGEVPWVAWTCTRYRMEFSVNTGFPFKPANVNGCKIEYTPDEIAKWAWDAA